MGISDSAFDLFFLDQMRMSIEVDFLFLKKGNKISTENVNRIVILIKSDFVYVCIYVKYQAVRDAKCWMQCF